MIFQRACAGPLAKVGAINCRDGTLASQGVKVQITRGRDDSATELRLQADGAVCFELSWQQS